MDLFSSVSSGRRREKVGGYGEEKLGGECGRVKRDNPRVAGWMGGGTNNGVGERRMGRGTTKTMEVVCTTSMTKTMVSDQYIITFLSVL